MKSVLDLPELPQGADGPQFQEPWEAQAFAMAVALEKQGLFTWSEWAQALGSEIKRAQSNGDADDGTTYYHHWMNALERILNEKKITSRDLLAHYQDAWERAAKRTPHGQPVELHAEDHPVAD